MPFKPSPAPEVHVLESLIVFSRVKVAVWHPEGACWQVSPGLNLSLGLPESWGEWSSDAWSLLLHDDDRANVLAALQSCTDGQSIKLVNVRIKRRDMGWSWFNCNSFSAGKQPVLVFDDVTIARQDRAALLDSHVKLRGVYDAAPAAIIFWGKEGRISDWNPMAERMFGWSTDAMIGQKLVPILIEPAHYDAFAGAVNFAARGHQVGQVTCRSLKQDGSVIHCDWRTVAIYGASGKLSGLLSLVTDVTDMIAAQESLLRAKEQAESLNRAKSEFLLVIGHELRTPLNGVLGMAQVLESIASEEEQTYIQPILTCGRNLRDIVDCVNDYTSIDAVTPEDVREAFDPDDLAANLLDQFRAAATEKGLALSATLAASVRLSGDRRGIEKILRIFIQNAIHFTKNGHVQVTSATEGGDGAPVTLRLSVQDTGIGIDAERLPNLFAPFSHAQDVKTRAQGGIGLGLALARKLADRMQGRLIVSSELGVGSTFSLEVELASI
ncbi:PAS domain S-box protein [Burkholderiaceae bacterium DAT-1]|nr:PAS domain S-box protein [Burkholderiaceae bacterium DAT-1]